ncbi:MAG: hypothetical protein QNJ36_20305 [Calothrix sp. MO_167.B42]|nr:hypothetical protein [Calothrix sp. MO_167.B42]
MNKVQYEAKEKFDFSSLQACHKQLYEQVSDIIIQEEISRTPDKEDDWSKKIQEVSDDIKNLIDNLAQFASQVTSIDEYNWVKEAAYEWGAVGDCLEVTLPLSDTIETDKNWKNSGQRILSSLPKSLPGFSFTSTISKEYIEKTAHDLSEARKLRLIGELRDRLGQVSPSNLEEFLHYLLQSLSLSNLEKEMNEDWYSACTYFSSKIMEGKLDLACQVTSELYDCLEEVWLEDVKHLKAYQVWWDNGGGWISEESIRVNYYLQACQQIADSLFDPYIKAPLIQFGDIKDYLKTHYLTDTGKFDRGKSHNLIKRKAYRLWEKNASSNERENWSRAEQYVKNFYGNIMSAIIDGDLESLDKVKKAIQSSIDPDHKYIINCFEIALVIYFLKEEMLQDVKEI